MAGGWPLGMALANPVSYGANTTNSMGTGVASSTTANTKGSYVELFGSPTTSDMTWAHVTIDCSPFSVGGAESSAIDLAIGASGSQQVVVSNLLNYGQVAGDTYDYTCSYFFPLALPSGTHLWARSQTTQTSGDPVGVSLIGFDSSFHDAPGASCSCYDTYGFVSGSTMGTTLTASGTANLKGAYSTIVSSVAHAIQGFFLAFDSQGSGSNTLALIDLAIGAAGQEVVIMPNILVFSNSAGVVMPQTTPFIPIAIKLGTRIAARCQSSSGGKTYGITLYGLRQ